MTKMTLDQSYIYEGKHYGPGETEVPDGLAENLKARMKAKTPDDAPETVEDAQHSADAPKQPRSRKAKADA